ncbi:MAG: hypothetical protein ACK4RW_06765 [Rehaibacterium terrae]|uniref:hypothetical protein n=1 Tax=Rehaibacterium terrae TaxID=1341696 RepID=UPI003919BF10
MIRQQLADAAAQWRQNRRLRLAVLAGLLVLGFHLVSALADRRDAVAKAYQRDLQLLTRLDSASRQAEWPARAEQAREALLAVQAGVPRAQSAGLAQAELQAWLTEQASQSGLVQPRVRTETTLDVPGRPELWQVVARMDAEAGAGALATFLQAMSASLPWVQVERLEVREAREGVHLSLIVRAYYHRPAGDRPADEEATP